MRFVFLVQGEGRGHMTQAIALKQALCAQGHEVAVTLIGKSRRREIPKFFSTAMGGEVYGFHSPNFHTHSNAKGIAILPTLLGNVLKSRKYIRSLRYVHRWMQKVEPDAIINFYDFLGGLYSLIYKPSCPFHVIGHQYLAYHPDFPFAPGLFPRLLFKLCNRITSFRANTFLALSYAPYSSPERPNLKVLPPLLRKEVFDLEPSNQGFLLVYLVNAGYGEDIIQWHQSHPDVKLHCFWDKPEHKDVWSPHENLSFHPIDDRKFLKFLASCRAYICTAGFESVCEALYLGKPIMTIPVEGQYEQACNALDASQLGQVMSSSTYDIDRFLDFMAALDYDAGDSNTLENSDLNAWYRKGAERMTQALIEEAAAVPSSISSLPFWALKRG
jgi:uncharacterized protein (TIGR00661 family)